MDMGRRDVLKLGALTGLLEHSEVSRLPFFRGLSGQGALMSGFRAPALGAVRVGVIGVGHRGSGAVKRLSSVPGVTLVAISDLYEERAATQAKWLAESGKPVPRTYFGSKDEWRKLCESKDVDLVYICTPWLWHTPMAVYAMRCGKHAATEVPAAVTLEQCWELVDTAESTQRHCMMLENCCYGFSEMLALMLCRKGVLGTLVHGEAAYIHDLRDSKLKAEKDGGYQGQWRLEWAKQHTGNPYPTHGLGPVCQYMNVNRGDRMVSLTSVSSDQFGLTQAASEKFGKTSPQAKTTYKLGDMNTTLIQTALGRTIVVKHDTTSPRPYTRINTITGTKGILSDYPLRVALAPKAHEWLDDKALAELKVKYAHPLWDKTGETAKKVGGHGGMDYLMDLRLCHCLSKGLPLDMDVYDAALWSSLVELSEQSVLGNAKRVDVPDFTRGGWRTAVPLDIVTV